MAGLPWVRLDPNIARSPELSGVRAERGGDRAAFIFLSCLMWSKEYEQQGRVPPPLLDMFGGTKRDADLLVAHGLWTAVESGWVTAWYADPLPGRRPHIPVGVRSRVYERDGHACVICGNTERLSLDHIVHWSNGGEDTVSNLRTLCIYCNSSRRDKTDAEWLGAGV